MTFTFTAETGLLFFISFGLALLIASSDFSRPDVPITGCSMHPHQSECAHRRKPK